MSESLRVTRWYHDAGRAARTTATAVTRGPALTVCVVSYRSSVYAK